jgi:hypothetical protein
LPKLNQEVIKNGNRSVTSNVIETVVKNLPTKKSTGPDRFTAEFHQAFNEELTPMFLKLFHKVQRKDATKYIVQNQYYTNTKAR